MLLSTPAQYHVSQQHRRQHRLYRKRQTTATCRTTSSAPRVRSTLPSRPAKVRHNTVGKGLKIFVAMTPESSL